MSAPLPRVSLTTLAPLLERDELEAVLHVRNLAWHAALDDSAHHYPPPAADAPMPTQTDAAVYLEPFAFDTPARVAALVDRVRNGASTLYPVEGRALVAEIDRLRAELAAVKRGAP